MSTAKIGRGKFSQKLPWIESGMTILLYLIAPQIEVITSKVIF